MSTYITTVIKTGNSYALRVPKQYITDAQLHVGQKADIELPVPSRQPQDRQRIQEILGELQARGGVFTGVKDPSAWQRSMREDRPMPGRD